MIEKEKDRKISFNLNTKIMDCRRVIIRVGEIGAQKGNLESRTTRAWIAINI